MCNQYGPATSPCLIAFHVFLTVVKLHHFAQEGNEENCMGTWKAFVDVTPAYAALSQMPI